MEKGRAYFHPDDPENVVVEIPGDFPPEDRKKQAKLLALKLISGLSRYIQELEVNPNHATA